MKLPLFFTYVFIFYRCISMLFYRVPNSSQVGFILFGSKAVVYTLLIFFFKYALYVYLEVCKLKLFWNVRRGARTA